MNSQKFLRPYLEPKENLLNMKEVSLFKNAKNFFYEVLYTPLFIP